jgi:hypothetical protein
MGIKDLLQKLLEPPKPKSSREIHQLEPILIDGESFFLAKGTSHRQPALKSLGVGEHNFLLTPEKNNKYDSKAVMVQGIQRGNSVHVGYLPMGSAAQETVHKLGNMMMKKGKIIMVEGEVLEGDTGLIVRLFMPDNMTLRAMESEYK